MNKLKILATAIIGILAGALISHLFGRLLISLDLYAWIGGHLVVTLILIGLAITFRKRAQLLTLFISGTMGYMLFTVAITALILAMASGLAMI